MSDIIEFDGVEHATAAAVAVAEADEPVRLSREDVISRMRKDLAAPRTKQGYRYVQGPHTGPNRAMRRKAAQLQRRRMRAFATWQRQLLAVGINPEDVLAARRARRERQGRPAAGGDRPDSRHGAGQD